ncbi:MAG: 1-acyl-sn-glycerol-3-phosphate acyltransferase [Pseudomonadota bacterium]
MQGVIEIPVWVAVLGGIAAAIAILDRVLAPSVRWYLRRRLNKAVERLNTRLSLRIQPFKLMRRSALIERLAHDPEVMRAVEHEIRETGMPRGIILKQVQRYAREITPSFSAIMYFGVGARVSRWIARLLYRVRLGALDQEALSKLDASSSVVFVMNHRSNMDYLLVTYIASTSSALSYAVGEWARIWPLSRLIRSMGAYFIRRQSRGGLYRAVLRRYVQMATEGGVAQAIFPEGGLSRDGRLGRPKLGLLSYIVDEFDSDAALDVVFVPVGINYDRVLEDRILLAADAGPAGRARFKVDIPFALRAIIGYLVGRITGRTHRFGYAAVSFGTPLSLSQFMQESAATDVKALGRELSRRIGAIVPVLPTALVASVMAAAETSLTSEEIVSRCRKMADRLEGAGAHIHVPRKNFDYAVEVGLRMLTSRGILIEDDRRFGLAISDAALLGYYANSIAHLLAEDGPTGA